MDSHSMHKIWIDQCHAAHAIKVRFGPVQAFDYLVGEKLLNFASAAVTHPEFRRELPSFVAEVRRIFTPEEIQVHLGRITREAATRAKEACEDENDVPDGGLSALEARAHQFM